jgi:hypothetical protein
MPIGDDCDRRSSPRPSQSVRRSASWLMWVADSAGVRASGRQGVHGESCECLPYKALADTEGNEMCICTWTDRDERGQ